MPYAQDGTWKLSVKNGTQSPLSIAGHYVARYSATGKQYAANRYAVGRIRTKTA